MVFCIVVAYTVGMYVLVYTQYTHSIDSTHCLHRDALIKEAISYHSISPRGSLKSTSTIALAGSSQYC